MREETPPGIGEPGAPRLRARVEAVLGSLAVAFGVFSLHAQLCVLARIPFRVLGVSSVVPLLAGVAAWRWASRRRALPLPAAPACPPRGPACPARWRPLRVLAPLGIAGLQAATGLEPVVWTLAVLFLWTEVRTGVGGSPVPAAGEAPRPRLEAAALLGLALAAALVTAAARRPDADDAYFLAIATAAVDFPDASPQSFDGLHRSGLPPVVEELHLPQVYELLVALLSLLPGASIQTLYYVVLPPLWAFLGILAHWAVLRRLLPPRPALSGTAVLVAVLVLWGDGHRTFGSFAFVRIFQGKGICLVAVLPLIVLAALRYRERAGAASWLLLASSQLAAAGLTTNGVVVAPLAALLALAAPPVPGPVPLRRLLGGLSACLPLLLVSAAMYLRAAPYLRSGGTDPYLPAWETTLGSSRTPLVLLALLLLPGLAERAGAREQAWAAGHVALCVLLVLCPAVPWLAAATLGPVFSWRLAWAVPVPLLLALAAGCAAAAGGPGGRAVRAGAGAWLAAFALAGPPAAAPALLSPRNVCLPKTEQAPRAAAARTVELARKDAPALLPEPVAACATGFRGFPPLVAVRETYLRKLRGFVPGGDLEERFALLRYVSQGDPALALPAALAGIDARGVATVVFPRGHRDAAALARALAGRGFELHEAAGFTVAARPAASQRR